MAALDPADHVVICSIVRGEILFGIARLPPGGRRDELEKQAIGSWPHFRREPVPERAGDFYVLH